MNKCGVNQAILVTIDIYHACIVTIEQLTYSLLYKHLPDTVADTAINLLRIL